VRAAVAALFLIAASVSAKEEAVPAFPSPVEMALSANGSRLYVVCEGTNEVIEIDAVAGSVIRRVRVGQHPKSISVSTDGRFLYVANSWSDTVSVIGVDT
jgi:YVTN family beta-propeller protein